MPYDPIMVQPMRDELARLGFQELFTPEDVDNAMKLPGTTLVAVNSVCGCAAGVARPGIALALNSASVLPDNLVTVFAGQDLEATARAREYFTNQPPSSPQIALMKDGEFVAMIHRYHIEGRSAQMVAQGLTLMFEEFCEKPETAAV